MAGYFLCIISKFIYSLPPDSLILYQLHRPLSFPKIFTLFPLMARPTNYGQGYPHLKKVPLVYDLCYAISCFFIYFPL